MGPGPVSPGCVGHMLLLHLERSQVNWEGERPGNYRHPNAIGFSLVLANALRLPV